MCLSEGFLGLRRILVEESALLGWLLLSVTGPAAGEMDLSQQLLRYVMQPNQSYPALWSRQACFKVSVPFFVSFLSEMKTYLYQPLLKLFSISSLYFKVMERKWPVNACFGM